jgi:hypothetical protein
LGYGTGLWNDKRELTITVNALDKIGISLRGFKAEDSLEEQSAERSGVPRYQ